MARWLVVGLWLRAYAAGYLHKQEVLTVTGPYAYTRNPLYLGSAILALGIGIATRSWISISILGGYFAVFYSVVMRREDANSTPAMVHPSRNTLARSRCSSLG